MRVRRWGGRGLCAALLSVLACWSFTVYGNDPVPRRAVAEVPLERATWVATPNAEPIQDVQMVVVKERVFLVAATRPILMEGLFGLATHRFRVLIGEWNPNDSSVRWQAETPSLVQVRENGLVWSVCADGRGEGLCLTLPDRFGNLSEIALAERERGKGFTIVAPQRRLSAAGYPEDAGIEWVDRINLADGDARITTFCGDDHLWTTTSSNYGKTWKEWGKLSGADVKSGVLKTGRRIAYSPYRPGPITCDLPNREICYIGGRLVVGDIDDGLVVGDERGRQWSHPQRLAGLPAATASVGLAALGGKVLIVGMTREGRFYVGTWDARGIANLPKKEETLGWRWTPEGEPSSAIQALILLRDESAIPLFIKYLDSKYNAAIRARAMEAVGEVRAKQALPILLDRLRSLPSKSGPNLNENDDAFEMTRRHVISALGSIRDPSALPVLEAIAASDREYDRIRRYAREAVQKIKSHHRLP